MFRFIAPSPKIPIPHNHKTITLPLAAFFFTHTIINQPPKREPKHNISITNNTSYWTKKIHRLCTKDRNVGEALRLLDRLSLRGYQPDSLNINTIIHALCHSNHFSEAHHCLQLFISSHCVLDERTYNVLIASFARYNDSLMKLIGCFSI
ncbi:pentatricopeptide repeat-containing protein At3g18020-like [Quercus lobata]|uniref:pentatricopeptide repeat-containing protein At3g18020-like n=1 Tax=Quercus lobata TaxID=97700 RepID=UPI0012478320|nr:pentatricopeptide repeat-containing protein At3g18020-like [Quercus lobata]